MQIKRTGLNSGKNTSDISYKKLKYKIISQFYKTNKKWFQVHKGKERQNVPLNLKLFF